MIDIGWLPDPEARPYWNDVLTLLEPAARRGNCQGFVHGDLVWLASEDGLLLGAATTRLLGDEAELKHVGGTRFREWVPQMEAMICDWARDCMAVRMVSRGRSGWIRINAPWGWRIVGDEGGLTLYEKVL